MQLYTIYNYAHFTLLLTTHTLTLITNALTLITNAHMHCHSPHTDCHVVTTHKGSINLKVDLQA